MVAKFGAGATSSNHPHFQVNHFLGGGNSKTFDFHPDLFFFFAPKKSASATGRRALSLSDVNDLCSTLFRVALSTGIGSKQASYDEAGVWGSRHVAYLIWLFACREWIGEIYDVAMFIPT